MENGTLSIYLRFRLSNLIKNISMRLSRIAILAIKGACPGIVKKLAKAIDASDPTIYRYISDNDDNLTKAAALAVIREETGLTDSEILVDSEQVVREDNSEVAAK